MQIWQQALSSGAKLLFQVGRSMAMKIMEMADCAYQRREMSAA
jgi:hypothetical protein